MITGPYTIVGNVVVQNETGLTDSELFVAVESDSLKTAIEMKCDAYYDEVASQKRYGRNGVTPSASCFGYASFPNPFQSECLLFVNWVADCNVYLQGEYAKVLAGHRAMPTPTEAVDELKLNVPFVW